MCNLYLPVIGPLVLHCGDLNGGRLCAMTREIKLRLRAVWAREGDEVG
jgi:hypothetical protein